MSPLRPKFFAKKVGRGQPRRGLWVVSARGYADEAGRIPMNLTVERFLGSQQRVAEELADQLNRVYELWLEERRAA